MIVVADPQVAEAALTEGRLGCPHCPGMLRPWARARARRVRGLPDPVQPRRAWCPGCRRSQVLLPGVLLPRRADATEVVGTALVAKAAGAGYRRIAADLDRPLSTVRRWLRVAGTPGHADWLRHQATNVIYQSDADLLSRIGPAGGALADALTALAGAVSVVRARFPEITAGTWALVGAITGGRLLLPAPAT